MSKLLWFKLAVSAGLLIFLLWKIDLANIGQIIIEIQPWLAILAAFVIFLQFGLATLRWHAVAIVFETRVNRAIMWRYYLIAQCFTQVLPSSVGGDVVRTWLLKRDGIPLRTSILITVSDRVIGVTTLLALVITVFCLPEAMALGASPKFAILLLCVIGLAICLLILLVAKLPDNWLTSSRYLRLGRDLSQGMWKICAGSNLILIGTLSLTIHILTIVSIWLLAKSLGLTISPLVLAVTIPLALLAATIPISIGGWGVREGVMVTLLNVYDIPADSSFALSLLFGTAMIIASLPGTFIWLMGRTKPGGIAEKIENVFQSY